MRQKPAAGVIHFTMSHQGNFKTTLMKKRFSINIQQEELDELHRRLSATRWTDEIDNEKWHIGTNKSYYRSCANIGGPVSTGKSRKHI